MYYTNYMEQTQLVVQNNTSQLCRDFKETGQLNKIKKCDGCKMSARGVCQLWDNALKLTLLRPLGWSNIGLWHWLQFDINTKARCINCICSFAFCRDLKSDWAQRKYALLQHCSGPTGCMPVRRNPVIWYTARRFSSAW